MGFTATSASRSSHIKRRCRRSSWLPVLPLRVMSSWAWAQPCIILAHRSRAGVLGVVIGSITSSRRHVFSLETSTNVRAVSDALCPVVSDAVHFLVASIRGTRSDVQHVRAGLGAAAVVTYRERVTLVCSGVRVVSGLPHHSTALTGPVFMVPTSKHSFCSRNAFVRAAALRVQHVWPHHSALQSLPQLCQS